jgi:hypothetical protein
MRDAPQSWCILYDTVFMFFCCEILFLWKLAWRPVLPLSSKAFDRGMTQISPNLKKASRGIL